MKKKKIASLFLAVLMMMLTTLSCYAETTQEKIENAKSQKEETQNSYHAAQNKINALESKKGELEAYLTELNQQMEDLKSNMEELQTRYEDKQAELKEVQDRLAEARAQEEKQYADMKLRIQYMYENSSSTYVDLLFDSENFTDFLNRAERISQITSYDRDMLIEYEKTKEIIAEREEEVAREQQEIVALQEESRMQQEEVTLLVESTYDEINTYAAQITEKESAAKALLDQVSSQEDTLNTLLKQAKDEEAAQAAAQKEKAAKQEEEQQKKEKPEESKTEEPKEEPEDDSSVQETEEEEETGSSSENGTYLGNFRLTGYCNCSSCCGEWANGLTASGTTPTQGRTVAMGGVPFGTKLLINGTVYTVEDRGTAYGHVDIYFDSHTSALAFGSNYADVYQLN